PYRTSQAKAKAMADLILASLPSAMRAVGLAVGGRVYRQIIRLHVGGDFFSQAYFDAWLKVATSRPDLLCYGYTKSLPFWCRRLHSIPDNFVLTASEGGKYDRLIGRFNLRFARVVLSQQDADGLELDVDDRLAMQPGPSFA